MSIDIEEMASAYIECALWSSSYLADSEGNPVAEGSDDIQDTPMDDNYGPEDIAPGTVVKMYEDCGSFVESNKELIAQYIEQGQDARQAGYDFWLARNGHGTGFWDRGLGKLGDDLTEAAKPFGSFTLYVGNNGKVYGQ